MKHLCREIKSTKKKEKSNETRVITNTCKYSSRILIPNSDQLATLLWVKFPLGYG